MELFDQFLTNYPRHVSAPRAVVHRGLSQIRLAVEGTRDWPQARRKTSEILDTIASNEEFGTAHADLGVLLPEIAQNLAREALAKNDAGLLEEASTAQAMVTKFLPDSDVLKSKNAATETLLARARHRFDRDRRAAETAAAIEAAVAKKEIVAAFKAYADFAAADATGASVPALRGALAEAAKAAAGAVKFVAEPVKPLAAEPDRNEQYIPLIVGDTVTPIEALRASIVYASTGGVAFAFDAADGKLLWRRTVGFDELLPPQRIFATADADTLLHDSIHREFLVVESRTGAIKRRLPIPRSKTDAHERSWASLVEGRLYLTLVSGRLYAFDLATGTADGFAQFPQPLQQAAAVDARNGVIYQTADDGVLYVLLRDGLKPLESTAVGTSGVWTTSPVRIGTKLLLFERRGDAGRMIVCETERDGTKPHPIGSYDFASYVPLPPVSLQRYVVTADVAGVLRAFDFSAAAAEGEAAAIRPLAEYRSAGGKQLRYLAAQGMQLWLAGAQLERLELQPTLGKLSSVKTYLPGTIAQGSPTLGEEQVAYVFADADRPGISIATVDKADGQERWRRRLGLPLAAPPARVGEDFLAFASDGATLFQFRIPAEQNAPSAATAGSSSVVQYADIHRLVGRPLIVSPDACQILVETKSAAKNSSTSSATPAAKTYRLLAVTNDGRDGGSVAFDANVPVAPPCAFQRGVIVPLGRGEVTWEQLPFGSAGAYPFLPPTIAGSEVPWTRPETTGTSLVISDRHTHLYRLELEREPKPALAQKAQAPLGHAVVGNLAALETCIYLVDSEHVLRAFQLPELAAGPTWNLEGPAAWDGPVAADSLVFAAHTVGVELECLRSTNTRSFSGVRSCLPTRCRRSSPGTKYSSSTHRGRCYASARPTAVNRPASRRVWQLPSRR
ncbi:MAG: hypothetical protein QM775_27555 [Pirellulales bacterium]